MSNQHYDQNSQSNFAPDPNRGDYNANAGPEGQSVSDVDLDRDPDTVGGTDRTYASDAVTGETGYGAGATGSINRGSEHGGVTTGAEDNSDAPANPRQARSAGAAMANPGMGARYSEANATAGELTNSDEGYSTGVAGGSGADEARGYRTSSDPEYGERDMGYGGSLDQSDTEDGKS